MKKPTKPKEIIVVHNKEAIQDGYIITENDVGRTIHIDQDFDIEFGDYTEVSFCETSEEKDPQYEYKLLKYKKDLEKYNEYLADQKKAELIELERLAKKHGKKVV